MKVHQEPKLSLVVGIAFGFLFGAASSIAAAGDELWDCCFGSPGVEGYSISAISIGQNEVFVGGTFLSIGGVTVTNIAKWDGQNWSGVGSGLGTGLSHGVGSLVYCGNVLYAGGLFTNAGSALALNVARWDGINWSALGSGVQGVVAVLATDGSNLYVGGSFTNAGGISSTNIARWDGQQWWPMSNGVKGDAGGIGAVDAIAVGADGVYVGGSITNASGVNATNIARWDGTNWWALGSGIPGRVRAVAVKGSEVYAGGDPFRQGNATAVYVSKWDGSTWTAIGTSDWAAGGGLGDLLVLGNDLYAGGSFVQLDNVSVSRIARWDGARWWALGSGVGGSPIVVDGRGVSDLASDGTELFAGGYFQLAGGKPSTNIALWHIPHSLSISQTGYQVSLSWPGTGTNFVLEAKEDLAGTNWSEVSQPVALHSNECVVTETIARPQKFYRLRKK